MNNYQTHPEKVEISYSVDMHLSNKVEKKTKYHFHFDSIECKYPFHTMQE
jgi:hypothetical protein